MILFSISLLIILWHQSSSFPCCHGHSHQLNSAQENKADLYRKSVILKSNNPNCFLLEEFAAGTNEIVNQVLIDSSGISINRQSKTNSMGQEATLKHIGVIGTKATIRTDIYSKKIKEIKAKLSVSSLATPLLAPMIEEGFFKNKISKTIINDYLSRPKLSKIDSLILGCTHYPLIRPEIEQYYKGKVVIFDSANIVAHHVQWLLDEKNLLHQGKPKKHRFYISDYTPSFEQSTKLFFKGKITLEQKNLWK